MTSKEFPARKGGSFCLHLDHDRSALITRFGYETLKDRYLMPGETPQDMFGRVAAWFANDEDHAQRLYDYMSRHWFMPSTPILSNGGLDRGNPISCFLNSVGDSLGEIDAAWSENVWLAAKGGGIGTNWSDVRGLDERIGQVGKSSGTIPFIKVMDSLTLGISQGSLRRGSAAVYMDIDHPDIERFIEIRKPTGDPNNRCLNIHHGVNITDAFMEAVRDGKDWDLIGRKDGEVYKTVSARKIWQKLLSTRMESGEPYLLFIDTVNATRPDIQKELGLKVRQSNLCSEITLPTGIDHTGNDRTAVCCLSSLNLERFLEWEGEEAFIKDVLLFLDNVLQDFIDRTENMKGFEKARYAAMRERSVGLGVMGFHSFLQSQGLPFEGVMAKVWNRRIFAHVDTCADQANEEAARELGACPDSIDATARNSGLTLKRWSNTTSVAPTASISIICGGTSAGIEPINGNIYTHKTLSGSFAVKNRHLEKIMREEAYRRFGPFPHDHLEQEMADWVADEWSSVLDQEGSVQHLDWMPDETKAVFRTAFEIDPRWYIEHAADRAPFVEQAISNNLFLPPKIHVRDLHMLHFSAWEKGVKSLYYCRSKSIQRAQKVATIKAPTRNPNDGDECLACQ